ncbi:MAG: hypothetical protein WCQ99_17735, partial [Pseudomonadota bacterium]
SCDGAKGVLIAITPNRTSFTVPAGALFGIQAFALNVKGDPNAVDFELPGGWVVVKSQGGFPATAFGVFIFNFAQNSGILQDPLVITACSKENADLDSIDFIIPNVGGYLFAALISGFYYDVQADQRTDAAESITSAWFATKGTLTAAEEIIFTAAAADGKVQLQWTAISEKNVLGYNIYRSKGIFGKFEIINDRLMYATGSASTTAKYAYTDAGVKAGLYAYKLMAIGTDGLVQEYGPVKLFTK